MSDVIEDDLLNADATITRNAPTRVSGGQWPDNYITIATIRARHPFAPGATELLLAERLKTVVTHITYTKPGVDIQRGDRLVIEGQTYLVTSVLPPSLPHHLKVMLEQHKVGSAA